MKKGVHGPLGRSNNTPPPKLNYVPPANSGIDIIHVDADILVLNKPAGLLSVPGNKPELSDSLETRAQAEYPTATTVHRLDRGTSGIFIMALNKNAHANLSLQFEKRETSKTYLAVVSGLVGQPSGTISQPMRTDWYNRPKQMIDPYFGREAVTKWRLTEQYKEDSLLEVSPITGRSHQIRVHMQWLGHPILGDEFYAPSPAVQKADRLMLHAQNLKITHPTSNDVMTFEAPNSFNRLTEKL